MLRSFLALSLGWIALPLWGVELRLEFGDLREGSTPPDFKSLVSGTGKPGNWTIVLDEVPSLMPPLGLNSKAPVNKRPVLAQVARDPIDEHFPLFVYDKEVFADFSLTTRFKTVGGGMEQMAGMAFRIQDERNYYVVRASSLGNSFRFYKFVDGQRSEPIGTDMEITKNVWHELTIECKANQIRFHLDGKEPIPALTDTSFSRGKIGFWTKSDSVSYFNDTTITYTAQEILAHKLIQQAFKRYPRLVGLAIYAARKDEPTLAVIASNDEKEIGQPSRSLEDQVISGNRIAYGKSHSRVAVTLPLHDRNGEAIAAVRVLMQTFPGQTEQNAIARAMPVVKDMEARVRSAQDLWE